MKKEDIIKHEITKIITIPVVEYNGSDFSYTIVGADEIEIVDPEKLSKFLAKYVKGKDLID